MPTAFSEALKKINAGEAASPPDYMIAADTFNTANNNQISNFVSGIPKFIEASVISGANQLYNIAPSIGNLLGGNFELSNTADVITSLDSNLGAFYKQHEKSVDLVGFLLSSVIPGTAGVKVLDAAQESLRLALGAGKFGTNMGKALRLLTPAKDDLVKKAIEDIVSGASSTSLLSKGVLKAAAAGATQSVYEAAAFETAVSATMFNSPILDNQTFGDFVSNVAWGAGVFGVGSALIHTAKISFTLSKATDTLAKELRPWTFVAKAASKTDTSSELALDYQQAWDTPAIPAELGADKVAAAKRASKIRERTLNDSIRANFGTLAGGDDKAADLLFKLFKGEDINAQQSAVIGLKEVNRMTVKGPLSSEFEALKKRSVAGTITADELNILSNTDISVSFAKMWGEDAGKIFTEEPTAVSVSDLLGPKDTLKTTKYGVVAGKHKFKFSSKKLWNIFESDSLTTSARYAWVDRLEPLAPTAENRFKVKISDIPMMEKVLRDSSGFDLKNVDFVGLPVGEAPFSSKTELRSFLGDTKIKVANALLEQIGSTKLNQDEIAAIVNVRSSALSGRLTKVAVGEYSDRDIFASQSYAKDLTETLKKKGELSQDAPTIDLFDTPQYLKLTYDSSTFKGVNNFVAENMVIIKEQQALYQQATSNAAAAAIGPEYEFLQEINSSRVFSGAAPSGAGPTFLAAASAPYGSLASTVEDVGSVVNRITKAAVASTEETLSPLAYKLGNNQEAAIEFSQLNAELRNTGVTYGLNKQGTAFEPLVIKHWKEESAIAAEQGTRIPLKPTLASDVKDSIPIKTKEAQELFRAHIEITGDKTRKLAGIRTSQGVQFNRDPEAFYPIPVDPTDFPHFAFVIDNSVTSTGHSKMLFANTEEDLKGMIATFNYNEHLSVLTKKEAERYYKARNLWEFEKTISSNYLDTAAKRIGTSSPALPATDPEKIVSDFMSWHRRRDVGLVREAVSAKYEVQFSELKALGDEATNIATSKASGQNVASYADEAVKNPFEDYIKVALNIKKTSDYPFWVNLNKIADEAVSKVVRRVSRLVQSAKSPEELVKISSLLKKSGYKGAAYTEDMEIFANAKANKQELTRTIQKANAVMATVVLRLDMLNAVNNAVSANVLLGAEASSVVRNILSGNVDAAGELAKLTKLGIPGTDKSIFTAGRAIAKAVAAFSDSSADMTFFKRNGFIDPIHKQYLDSVEALAFTGKESIGAWAKRIDGVQQRLKLLADKGEKWTGNTLAEKFNRFVASHVMKQFTDIAVKHDLMSSREQVAYIRTFVNRTQGNYLASQRPLLFHGPVGQAIGLFQTYQFNLMQQLLRHVGEGDGKDAMLLLGIQSTIHGLNGLPAFNALNTHILGLASGNKEHRDAYDAVYGAAGKEAGDWIMYGFASNALGLINPALKVNLYTRGDINPRQVTIVPTNPASVPIVSAGIKVFNNLLNTGQKLANGADVGTTLLQGLEHNGLSRPLAGLAQTIEGIANPNQASYSTSARGDVIAANDLLSLANLVRIAGGKPMDEAVAIDAMYRFKAYALADSNKRSVLGQAIKSTMIAGKTPTEDQMNTFAEEYAAYGGKISQYNAWMTQLYKSANLSQVNSLQRNLGSSFNQSMQVIMGGKELRDFGPTAPPIPKDKLIQ